MVPRPTSVISQRARFYHTMLKVCLLPATPPSPKHAVGHYSIGSPLGEGAGLAMYYALSNRQTLMDECTETQCLVERGWCCGGHLTSQLCWMGRFCNNLQFVDPSLGRGGGVW
jgi:hypothetical protein